MYIYIYIYVIYFEVVEKPGEFGALATEKTLGLWPSRALASP